jgi:hypothetical protein
MKRVINIVLFLFLSIYLSGQVVTTNVYFSPPVVTSSYCDEYQAVYDAMATPSEGDTLGWQNDLVQGLIDDGVWAKGDLFYVIAQRTSADAKINWINPGTYDLTDPGSTNPAFTKYEGFKGDGSSDYLSTNWDGADTINYGIKDASVVICIRDSVNSATYVLGAYDGTSGHTISLIPGNTTTPGRAYINSNLYTSFGAGATSSKAYYGASRLAANHQETYRNGVSINTDTDASVSVPVGRNVHILGWNNNGTLAYAPYQVAMIFLGGGLSDTEQGNIVTRFEHYMDHLGKGILP